MGDVGQGGNEWTSSNSTKVGPLMVLVRLAKKPVFSAGVSSRRCLIWWRNPNFSIHLILERPERKGSHRPRKYRFRGTGASRGLRRASGATRSSSAPLEGPICGSRQTPIRNDLFSFPNAVSKRVTQSQRKAEDGPRALFSGIPGTMTPGLLMVRASKSHRK